MHILHMVTRLLRGGSEENTWATCLWQATAGHRVTLVHGEEFDPIWYDDVPPGIDLIGVPELVHQVRPFADIRALRAIRALYARLKPDVIHTHQSKAGILGRIAADQVPDARVVHGIHIVPFHGVKPHKRTLFVAAEKRAARQTDMFIGVSHAMGHAYVDAGITTSDRFRCVRSGMDLRRFHRPILPDDWRDLLRLPASSARPQVALMLASFEPRKNHLRFLEAFAEFAPQLPDLKVVLAGTGPDEQAAQDLVNKLGLDNQIVFAGYRKDPEKLLALADVALLASEREGLPRVAVQALAADVPVIMRDLPGLAELVIDGKNGLLVNSAEAVAQLLASLMRSELELARLTRGAKLTDVSDWSLDALGAQTTALYEIAEPRQRQAI